MILIRTGSFLLNIEMGHLLSWNSASQDKSKSPSHRNIQSGEERDRVEGGRERERERELELATERSDAASEAQSSKERGGLSKLF